MTGTALVVDGQNLLMRSIFAAKGRMSSNGVPTGPLQIFINSLAKHVQEERPSRLSVVWDGGTSQARIARLPSYKANRKRVPEDEREFRETTSGLVRRFLALAGVHQDQMGGMEADDLIAAAWASVSDLLSDKIVILSSDKDFLQLVGSNPKGVETELVRLSSAGTPTDRWHYTRFANEYGYDTWRWPLVTALAGDKGDGVPGLPGIGPVKAMKLLESVGWDPPRLREHLDADEFEIFLACFDVVNLRNIRHQGHRPPVWRPTDQTSLLWPDLIEFLSSYEMITVKDRLMAGGLWSDRDLISVTEGDRDPSEALP